jgi:hypothetical protein
MEWPIQEFQTLRADLEGNVLRAIALAPSLAERVQAGRRRLVEALGDYERQRNEETRPIYELNYQRASLDPPSSEMQRLLGALHGNQAETNRFFGALAGTVPIPEFFAPEHIEQVITKGGQ